MFERDDSTLGKAFRRLAHEIFRPAVGLSEREESFKRQIAEAVNQTAQAAFTPRTTLTTMASSQAITTNAWVDLPDLEQLIVTPVPARIFTLLNLVVSVTTEGDDLFLAEVNGSGLANFCEVGVQMPAFGVRLFRWSVTAQDLFDAEPETLYTLTPRAKFNTGGIAAFSVLRFQSNFSVRVEPRSLVEE